MIHLPASVRVYLATAPCDMRRSFDGLHALVVTVMQLDAFAGHLFVFANKRRDRVKILYWDRDGFAVWAKRLEEGTYAMPFSEADEVRREITAQELGALFTHVFSLRRKPFRLHLSVPVDPKMLPEDADTLKRMLVDVTAQLDRTERLLRQLLQAKTGRKSEQLSREQLALFAQEAGITLPELEKENDDHDEEPPSPPSSGTGAARGRKPLPKHLKRERIEHDLPEKEKHCAACHQDLRKIGEEVSERYEYLPAQMKVIEDACFTYACQCTVKTASKPPQPIEKSTASASVLAQVIVSKLADHLPLHRQAKMFRRHGIEIAEQTMCGWMAQCAELLHPLYKRRKLHVLASRVVGTDDTPVKVLDRKLRQARKGRIWPYVGDRDHPAVIYDYTATRERAGPEEFLRNYRGYLQADAYVAYDSFFVKPERGMVEVGCWAHARRHVHQALDNDPSRMRTLLLMIAELYRVEKLARHRALGGEDLRLMREQGARPVLEKRRC